MLVIDHHRELHKLISRVRGKASSYRCVDCPNVAMDWSWIHGTCPEDICNYEPRCRSCHLKYDNGKRLNPIVETRRRMSIAQSGNTNASGQRSEESRKRMSQAKIGKRGNNHKFTQEQELEIIERWISGDYLQREIADLYGVSVSCIKRMIGRHQR